MKPWPHPDLGEKPLSRFEIAVAAILSLWGAVALFVGIGAALYHWLHAHLSPMGWAHISLTGDYLWDQARILPAGAFRPLNDPMAKLKLVA
jgi:hypothetical protein